MSSVFETFHIQISASRIKHQYLYIHVLKMYTLHHFGKSHMHTIINNVNKKYDSVKCWNGAMI